MIKRPRPVAIEVTVEEDSFTVSLSDGAVSRVPFAWFPTLKAATPVQRRDVSLAASGAGLRWHQLDEDISVGGLVRDAEHFQVDETLILTYQTTFRGMLRQPRSQARRQSSLAEELAVASSSD